MYIGVACSVVGIVFVPIDQTMIVSHFHARRCLINAQVAFVLQFFIYTIVRPL